MKLHTKSHLSNKNYIHFHVIVCNIVNLKRRKRKTENHWEKCRTNEMCHIMAKIGHWKYQEFRSFSFKCMLGIFFVKYVCMNGWGCFLLSFFLDVTINIARVNYLFFSFFTWMMKGYFYIVSFTFPFFHLNFHYSLDTQSVFTVESGLNICFTHFCLS